MNGTIEAYLQESGRLNSVFSEPRTFLCVTGVLVQTDVKSGGLKTGKKKTVFIHSDAFHTKKKVTS